MSSITITPALNHGDYHGGEPYGSPGNCGGHRPPGLDACDIDSHGINNRSGDFAGNGNGPVVIVISMPPELAGGYPGLNGNSPHAPAISSRRTPRSSSRSRPSKIS